MLRRQKKFSLIKDIKLNLSSLSNESILEKNTFAGTALTYTQNRDDIPIMSLNGINVLRFWSHLKLCDILSFKFFNLVNIMFCVVF